MFKRAFLDNHILKALFSILVIEVVVLSVLYKDVLNFECSSTGQPGICLAISELPIRGLCVAALLVVLLISSAFREQISRIEIHPIPNSVWLGIHVLGLIMIAAPLLFLSNSISSAGFLGVLALWLGGTLAAASGAIFALISPEALAKSLKGLSYGIWIAGIVAFLAPDWARVIQPIWDWEPITASTFNSVEFVLHWFEDDIYSHAPDRLLGVGDFIVIVGHQCSGVEGLGLITLFFTVFVTLFRDTLNMRRVWLLLPIGLALSWIFNIVRVSLLIWIGANVSPDLAINGFHSHAGWMFFAILSVGICVVANSIAWFRLSASDKTAAKVSTRTATVDIDAVTAQILPFIVLMAAVLLRSTFAENPDDLYPIQFVLLAAVLFYVSHYWLSLEWRVNGVSVLAGIVIAVMWVWATPPPDTQAATPSAFWIITRILGTALLIPLVEELFFRGYIIDKFRGKSEAALVLGVVISAVLFAALHDKWLLAGIAGVIFGLLVIRKGGKLSDAIIAHMVANVGVAGFALYTGHWSLI